MKSRHAFGLGILFAVLLSTGRAVAETVYVAVAANFTEPARNLVPRFEQTTGHSVKLSFGSTGKLYSQIENGAPFEVFMAADTRRPAKAEADGLAVVGSRFIYAKGKLALWSAQADAFTSGDAYLLAGDFQHLAIANPKNAPYGLAAQQAMEKLGVWRDMQSKLVRGDSISQTFQFVATGNAAAGFVAYSQVKAWKKSPGSTWEVPAQYHAPIEQAAVLLSRGQANPAAQAFLEFLKSTATKALIQDYGYDVD